MIFVRSESASDAIARPGYFPSADFFHVKVGILLECVLAPLKEVLLEWIYSGRLNLWGDERKSFRILNRDCG